MSGILNKIRQAIRQSGVSRYKISQETGISQAQLCRLMSKESGLSVRYLEAVAEHLGYEVVLKQQRKRSK